MRSTATRRSVKAWGRALGRDQNGDADPSLRARTDELPRIVDEYAIDAIAELRALGPGFTAADHLWVINNAP